MITLLLWICFSLLTANNKAVWSNGTYKNMFKKNKHSHGSGCLSFEVLVWKMLHYIIFNGILTSPFTMAIGLTWSLMGLKLSQPFRYLVIEISSATFPFLDLNSTSLSHFPYTVSWKEERSQCLCSYCQIFPDLLERHPFWFQCPGLLKMMFRNNSV